MKKYTVTYKDDSIDPFHAEKWISVVNYLIYDDNIVTVAKREYNLHREGRWDDDMFDDFMRDNVKEYAARVGYTIKD